MEWVRGLERIAGVLYRKPARELLLVHYEPSLVFLDRPNGLFGETMPLEQTAADDLRGLGLSGHDHGLPETVE
jgi:hypothetical protein